VRERERERASCTEPGTADRDAAQPSGWVRPGSIGRDA
jgi:hypothetical protein